MIVVCKRKEEMHESKYAIGLSRTIGANRTTAVLRQTVENVLHRVCSKCTTNIASMRGGWEPVQRLFLVAAAQHFLYLNCCNDSKKKE
mmetsp:Transcript_17190/g.48340  ORF Transcript_17190/g.48340 Transcript_17190/m.48340 type:complete len:88 (+) Transcript_17190:3525-3788(+)